MMRHVSHPQVYPVGRMGGRTPAARPQGRTHRHRVPHLVWLVGRSAPLQTWAARSGFDCQERTHCGFRGGENTPVGHVRLSRRGSEPEKAAADRAGGFSMGAAARPGRGRIPFRCGCYTGDTGRGAGSRTCSRRLEAIRRARQYWMTQNRSLLTIASASLRYYISAWTYRVAKSATFSSRTQWLPLRKTGWTLIAAKPLGSPSHRSRSSSARDPLCGWVPTRLG